MAVASNENSGMLTGLFTDRDSAERAYHVLTDRGYNKDEINVVMSEDTRKNFLSQGGAGKTEMGNKAAEGAGIGGATGGAVGAILAAVSAVGTSLVLPGLGLVVAGPLAAAAAGAGVGAATGGLIGALVGWGIPEERVKNYESGIKQGGILIGVRPHSAQDADYIEQQWRGLNGQNIYRAGSARSGTTGTGTEEQSVVGVYDDYHDAEKAAEALVAAGFPRSSMQLTPESQSPVAQQTGSTSGEKQHGIGGFFRSLFGMEEHKEHHDVYAESVRRGSYVLSVNADTDQRVDRASEIMNRFNAVDVEERAGHWRAQGWTGYDEAAPRYSDEEIRKERAAYAQSRPQTTTAGKTDTSRIPVVEEELKVGKRAVQRGGVRVFTRMRETPVHESVQLREEHVNVERHPVDRPATQSDMTAAMKEGSIELRETSEEAVVSKSARVVEEVDVSKQASQRTEEINDTVRRTDVEVEQIGPEDMSDFRRHWQSAYGTSGGRYEDYDAAYRYGSTMAGSGRYKNYQWNDVEPQLRSDWESNHPGSNWDKVKDAVRYGAERSGKQRR